MKDEEAGDAEYHAIRSWDRWDEIDDGVDDSESKGRAMKKLESIGSTTRNEMCSQVVELIVSEQDAGEKGERPGRCEDSDSEMAHHSTIFLIFHISAHLH